MGFNVNRNQKVVAEINVTPFVDVVLVLLVIFMITAPMMFSKVQLQLPKTNKVEKLNLNSKQVVLSYTKTGEYYIGKNKFLETEILEKIKNDLKANNQEVLYIRADYSLRYGNVASLMAFLKAGGITHIALVTEVEKKTP